MNRLPQVNFITLSKFLIKMGYTIVRQRGSHVTFRNQVGRVVIVPNHPGRDISRTLMMEILKQMEATPEEFSDFLSGRK